MLLVQPITYCEDIYIKSNFFYFFLFFPFTLQINSFINKWLYRVVLKFCFLEPSGVFQGLEMGCVP